MEPVIVATCRFNQIKAANERVLAFIPLLVTDLSELIPSTNG